MTKVVGFDDLLLHGAVCDLVDVADVVEALDSEFVLTIRVVPSAEIAGAFVAQVVVDGESEGILAKIPQEPTGILEVVQSRSAAHLNAVLMEMFVDRSRRLRIEVAEDAAPVSWRSSPITMDLAGSTTTVH